MCCRRSGEDVEPFQLEVQVVENEAGEKAVLGIGDEGGDLPGCVGEDSGHAKNFNMLSGMVNNDMRQNLYRGDVFVFVNASNNMMKLLRYEPGGSGHTR